MEVNIWLAVDTEKINRRKLKNKYYKRNFKSRSICAFILKGTVESVEHMNLKKEKQQQKPYTWKNRREILECQSKDSKSFQRVKPGHIQKNESQTNINFTSVILGTGKEMQKSFQRYEDFSKI